MIDCLHCNEPFEPQSDYKYCPRCFMFLVRGTRPFEQEAKASAMLAEGEE